MLSLSSDSAFLQRSENFSSNFLILLLEIISSANSELKELNSEDNSLQCFVNTEIDDFQENEDSMEQYFQIGKGESCSYSTIEEFIADVEFEKVSNINKEALKLSQSQSKMDELRDIVR